MPVIAETSFIDQMLNPPEEAFSPGLARYILSLKFTLKEQKRIDILSSKANEGTLTENERAELEQMLHIASKLGVLQSKARTYLKKQPAA